jgi:tetratricopeptide (TPR) repeat protein
MQACTTAPTTLLLLLCAQLSSTAVHVGSQPSAARRATIRPNSVAEPPELDRAPLPPPPPPTPATRQFAQSKAIRAADPEVPATLGPAIHELNSLIEQEPRNSDFYFLRASLACYAHAGEEDILHDVAASMSLHDSHRSAYETLREHHVLKAKIEFEHGHYQEAMRDLDEAIKEDYETAQQVFNDGKTKASMTTQPCAWTLPDLDALADRFQADYRPPLYRGLYLSYFLAFDLNSDYKPVLDAFNHAAELAHTSPLPHFFTGTLYTIGRLGGLMSIANAKCLDYIVPRTEPCAALDDARRTGVRALTRAIALDSKFTPAYAIRANALYDLKEYRQAIRDYDQVLELAVRGKPTRSTYNDRGLAKMALRDYRSAVKDFDQSISLGCDESCQSYDNRADAYLKLGEYAKAIADINRSINRVLTHAVFLMNIEQFRRIYPEYDSVSDDVLCEKLRAMFFPTFSRANFAEEFLIRSKNYSSTVLPDLYIKRGDAYASLKQKAMATRDYDRISRAFPDSAAIYFVEMNGKRVRRRGD